MSLLDDVYDELVTRRVRRLRMKLLIAIVIVCLVMTALTAPYLPSVSVGCFQIRSTDEFCYLTLKVEKR